MSRARRLSLPVAILGLLAACSASAHHPTVHRAAVAPGQTWYACANAAGAAESTRAGTVLPKCGNKTDPIWQWSVNRYTPPTVTTTTTAPATTTTQPAATGVNKARPFSAASPFNTATASGTQWFDTPTLHQLADGSFRHWWVGVGSMAIWWSAPSDPLWTFTLPDYIATAWHRNRPAASFQVRAPANIAAATDADHVLFVADPTSGNYVEVWQASVNASIHTVTNIAGETGWATGNMITGPGGGTLANNDGVRAANFSWAAGEITGADLAAGKINHALEVSLPFDMLMGGGLTGKQGGQQSGTQVWRAPATAWDAGFWAGPIQMGSRLGIPASAMKPAGLSPLGAMMFDALKTYGAFVGDFAGGQWPVFTADDQSVTEAQMCPLFCYWNYSGSADMEKIGPLLRVADYQP